MMKSYYFKASIAVAVLGAVAYGEARGESHPHAQYVIPSTANNLLASGGHVSNVSAAVVTYTYTPAPVNLEFLLPHERLVIQNSALTPPTTTLPILPATGANPFFQRRQRAPRMNFQHPKFTQFWCSSFQKFRGRMVT
jgi:hypothetical protein